VVDKELALGLHQTGRNSGVLHSGVYYAPGSLKARLCVRGKTAMEHFAAEKGIHVAEVGKLIVASHPGELARLDELERRARANGVPDLRVVDDGEIADVEPQVVGVRALHAPHTAAIDFGAVLEALAADVRDRGGEIALGHAAVGIARTGQGVVVEGPARRFAARAVITCAGLQSDRLAHSSGVATRTRIVPFRGDYYTLAPRAAAAIRGHVYPVPDPRFPFLGVHLTRKVDGAVVAGPNAVLALARERYRRLAFDPRDAASALAFPGLWLFAGRHVRTAAAELWRDVSKRAFVAHLRRYVPALTADDVRFGPTGIRAQAMLADGSLVDDFVIEGGDRTMHVLNAPSPGATASLAIGEELARRALANLIDAHAG